MASMKVSPEREKFIRAYAKRRGMDAATALDTILGIAQARVNALANYAKSGGGKKASKKSSKKVAKPKVKAKARASKPRAPKGFKSNSTTAPATAAAPAEAAAN